MTTNVIHSHLFIEENSTDSLISSVPRNHKATSTRIIFIITIITTIIIILILITIITILITIISTIIIIIITILILISIKLHTYLLSFIPPIGDEVGLRKLTVPIPPYP
jgi:hypothetical protein